MSLFHFRRPAETTDSDRGGPLGYDHVGSVLARSTPAGFVADRARAALGRGPAAFAAARAAIDDWQMFALDWIWLEPARPVVEVGATVTVVARGIGLWSANDCRITALIDEPGRYGFVYTTLERHVECGEELFLVTHDAESDEVAYELAAHSRARALLARIGYPVTRAFQARFRRESCDAMRRAVESSTT